jgi:hypothetical protein
MIGGAFVTAAALSPSLLVLVITQISSDKQNGALGGDQTKLVNDAQALVVQLGAVAATSSPARTVADVVAKRPKGVTLSRIVYTAGTPATLELTGAATQREQVSAYRALLASDSRFASVSVPINALLGADNGNFTITMTGRF